MKNYLLVAALLFVLVAISCKKKHESMRFTGITNVDKLGKIEGKPDSTDWRSDDTWTENENSLFTESGNNCATQKIRVLFYPNPCRNKSRLFAFKDSTVRMAIRLIDKDMNVIMKSDSIMSGGVEINLTSYKTDDTLRVYYKFFTKEGCEYKGHGDIFVNPYK